MGLINYNSIYKIYTLYSGGSRPSDKRGGGGGRGAVIQTLRIGGARSQKNFFRPFGPQFGLKISAVGGGGPSPGPATVHYVFSFYKSIIVPSNWSSHTYQSGSGFARFQALISPSLRRHYYGCWTVHTSLSSAHPQETKTRLFSVAVHQELEVIDARRTRTVTPTQWHDNTSLEGKVTGKQCPKHFLYLARCCFLLDLYVQRLSGHLLPHQNRNNTVNVRGNYNHSHHHTTLFYKTARFFALRCNYPV